MRFVTNVWIFFLVSCNVSVHAMTGQFETTDPVYIQSHEMRVTYSPPEGMDISEEEEPAPVLPVLLSWPNPPNASNHTLH